MFLKWIKQLPMVMLSRENRIQEDDAKKDGIKNAMSSRYLNTHVLKIGDAIGDYDAAVSNGVLFYPIIPGDEVDSWKRLKDEAFDRFLKGAYQRDYMDEQTKRFLEALHTVPLWE